MLRRSIRSLSASSGDTFAHCKAHYNNGVARICELIVDRGEGCYLFDAEGKKYLDFIAGIGVINLGYNHPTVTKAARDQIDKLWHNQIGVGFHTPLVKFIDNMRALVPAPLDNVMCLSTGSEAVESVIKLSRTRLMNNLGASWARP